jgi:hypothetical protein
MPKRHIEARMDAAFAETSAGDLEFPAETE